MDLRKPTHPGVILFEEYLQPRNLSIKAFAAHTNIHANTISNLVSENRNITVYTAMRFARALGTTVDYWLDLQRAVDKWDVLSDAAEMSLINEIQPIDSK